jgi:multidrug efflux pump subunit AcrA (membrane-fusion protein)
VATDVIMPALGVAQDTGRVVRWLHAEGDAVRQNQPLIEVETDKVTVELEAPAELEHFVEIESCRLPRRRRAKQQSRNRGDANREEQDRNADSDVCL